MKIQVNLDIKDQIELTSVARLGLFAMTNGTIPVGTVFYPDGSRRVNIAMSSPTGYEVGESYMFDNIQYPYEFYTQVCPDYGKLSLL